MSTSLFESELDVTRKDLVWFRDKKSGMVFPGDGAFVDVHDPSFLFRGGEVELAASVDLDVIYIQKGICVSWIYCDHPQRYYAPSYEGIKLLTKLIGEGREFSIEISPGYLDLLIEMYQHAREAKS